jgi:hypothetical protein
MFIDTTTDQEIISDLRSEYYVWPDGTYCEPEELTEMMYTGHSDDFEKVLVEDDEALEAEIHRVMTGSYPKSDLEQCHHA